MVLLPGEKMESGLSLLGESLGPVITCGDLEVKAPEFSALVLVFDAKVGERNLVVHNFEVVFVCDPDALVGQILVGINPRQLLVELLFEFVVKNDTTNLAAHIINLSGDLVIKAVEISVAAGFLGLDQAVIERLPIGNELCSLNKPVALLYHRQNPGRVWGMSHHASPR